LNKNLPSHEIMNSIFLRALFSLVELFLKNVLIQVKFNLQIK